nr:transposase (putative), gypsy type [Tanacetum cinerariifolium]
MSFNERVFPTVVDWRTNASKDGMPANGTYSVEDVRALDTRRTPIQKQPEMLLCVVGISRRYYLGDEVNGPIQFDSCSKSYEGKDWEPPPCPHEVPLLTLTATRVIEMDEPAVATDSSGVPSTIERSPLDFAHEAEASGRGTAAPEMPPPEDVPAYDAPRADQAREAVAAEPPAARESRKRGHDGTDANAPQSIPANVSDPDPLAFADAPSPHPADVAQSSQSIAAAGDPESENVSSPAEVGSPGSVYRLEWGVTNGSLLDTPEACQDLVDHVAPSGYFSELRHMHNEEFLRQYNVNLARQARELEIKRLKASLEAKANAKRAAEDNSAGLSQELERMHAQFLDLQVSNERLSQQVATLQQQRCAEMDARLDALSVDFDEELYPHMLTAIAGRRWVIGHGLRLAVMKCGESLDMRQAFADVVSAEITKGMSEGLRYGVEHGQAQRNVESIEAYDPEAEAKFTAALQALKDLKYPLLDQLEGLKDAPIDMIMAAMYLDNNTGEDVPQCIRDLRPSSSQLTIPVYLEVRDPRNPWACKEEIGLADAIAANTSRVEQKKRSRIVCRTHGVGSAHHVRSDRVPVSAPIVVPQGLALLLVDAATQTKSDDT